MEESTEGCSYSEEKMEDSEFVIALTKDEMEKLAKASKISNFHRQKLEKDAKKNWDLFYKRNGDRFFKNRYWTRREFEELFTNDVDNDEETSKEKKAIILLEIGCGCGDFVLPLLDDKPVEGLECKQRAKDMFIYCCDISSQAIDILKRKPLYTLHNPNRIKAFVADITEENGTELLNGVENRQVDVVSLIFVLSALDPEKMRQAIRNIHTVLRHEGLVLFRDYAINDKSMLRFSENSKICDRFYVRQDGTRAYFFSKEELLRLFVEEHHFQCISIEYVKRETLNNATKDKFSRVFLQAKFRKRREPLTDKESC